MVFCYRGNDRGMELVGVGVVLPVVYCGIISFRIGTMG